MLEVQYRDGRYHRLGLGFLGFGQRILKDLDTGARVINEYDNVTAVEIGGVEVVPFTGQIKRQTRIVPALPSEPAPKKEETASIDMKYTVVPTNNDNTYFTLPTERRTRRLQDATILRDTTVKVSDFDSYGNVLAVDVSTVGVDVTLHLERTVKNDTERWVLGKPDTQ